MISGDNFVVLSLGVIILSIVGYFLPNIEQFSYGDFLIKFKMIKNEANRTLEELKKAQIDSFRVLLKLSRNHPGWLRSDTAIKDERLDNFWDIVSSIKSQDIELNLKSELLETAKIIKNGQFDVIRNFIDIDNQYRKADSRTIEQVAMESYIDYENRKFPDHSDEQKKENREKLIDAINIYRNIENYINKISDENNGLAQ